jgi:hypothetical protein
MPLTDDPEPRFRSRQYDLKSSDDGHSESIMERQRGLARMLGAKYARRQAIIKEVYVGVIAWAFIAVSLAAAYFLLKALFFHGSWRTFIETLVGAWLLYRVSLHYASEKERGG